MAVHILHDVRSDEAVLYCSTSDWAFGPVFHYENHRSADERAEAFLRWLDGRKPREGWAFGKFDVRFFGQPELEREYIAWLSQEGEQYKREHEEEFS